MSPPVIDYKKCKCRPKYCVEQCPLDVLHLNKQTNKPEVRYPDECWHCGVCRFACPFVAVDYRFPLNMLL